jgi:hypothetical protein
MLYFPVLLPKYALSDAKKKRFDVKITRRHAFGMSAVRIPVIEKCGAVTTICICISAGLLRVSPKFFAVYVSSVWQIML